MDDRRLFHRYPSSLRVAFRLGGRGCRGRLTDVSAGGGFVQSNVLPQPGTRIQMAAQVEKGQPSVWLDLRVTWTRPAGRDSDSGGFGGYWLYASSRYGESNLREFLAKVLGITLPVIRPMSPPEGGETVYVYRFPDVYDRDDDEFPWAAERARRGSEATPKPTAEARPAGRHSSRSGTRGAAAEAGPRSKDRGRMSPALDSAATPSHLGEEPCQLRTEEEELGSLTEDEHPAPDLSEDPSEERPGESEPAAPREGRWSFLTRKLSGIRLAARREGAGAAAIELADGTSVVEYKLGKKLHTARVVRVGTGWLVFEPAGGAEAPDVWSRVEVRVPLSTGRKARDVELHVTVTRVKELEDGATAVHCKVNRVDEKGAVGAYQKYVEAFNARWSR